MVTKIHIKKQKPNNSDDIDNGVFYCADFGNCGFCPDISWEDDKRNYLTQFINNSDTAELRKYLKIGKNVYDPTRNDITQIVQKYWDCFYKEGTRRTILGYEFGINTGYSKPV